MEGKGKREEGRKTEMKKWREVPGAVADPGGGGGASPLKFRPN